MQYAEPPGKGHRGATERQALGTKPQQINENTILEQH
jgi:hypothetical protein